MKGVDMSMGFFDDVYRAVLSTGVGQINNALKQANNQLELTETSGNGRILISFIDLPILVYDDYVYMYALMIKEDRYGNQEEFQHLIRPFPSSTQYLICKTRPPFCGDGNDYKVFSYAAEMYAHQFNGRYPKGFGRNQIDLGGL